MSIQNLYEDLIAKEEEQHFIQDDTYRIWREALLEKARLSLTPADRVYLARYKNRPKVKDFIYELIDNPLFFRGDRFFGDDEAVITGIGQFQDTTVTFIGIQKGSDLEESIRCNFGMVHPEGYRKAIRMIAQAEKFKRPILSFIDTPGAYPGVGAEERGQAEAIARTIYAMSGVKVPTISVITGEGASGGAIALAVSDHLMMLENAIFSILSPEGFASILWKDGKRAHEAVNLMKLTADDIFQFGYCDEVVPEVLAPLVADFKPNFHTLQKAIEKALMQIEHIPIEKRLARRHEKYERNLWD